MLFKGFTGQIMAVVLGALVVEALKKQGILSRIGIG